MRGGVEIGEISLRGYPALLSACMRDIELTVASS